MLQLFKTFFPSINVVNGEAVVTKHADEWER